MSSELGISSGSKGRFWALAAVMLFSLVPPAASELVDQQIFSGDVCTFEPENPCSNCTYRWEASGGSPLLSDSGVYKWTAPSVLESKTVVINLTTTNEIECIGQEEMEVVVSPGQMVNGPDEICDGQTAHFSANAEFDSYEWEAFDAAGAAVGGFNDTVDAYVSWTPPGPGEYIVALNGLDVGQGYQKRVTVHETPVCVIVSEDVVCAGATIGMETAEDPDYRYLWEATGGAFRSSKTSTTNWTAPDDPGEYTIHLLVSSATFDCSCGTQEVVTVVSCKPEIQVVKDCVYEPPVRVGDFVTYTYEVENVGDLPLREVNLTDIHDWGSSCVPTLVGGDSGDEGVMGPGESWLYECRYQIPNPSDFDQLLTVMAVPRSGGDAALIARLSRMTARLEIKLESMIEMRDRFNFSRAQMEEDEIFLYDKNLTLQNYTDTVTKETLSLAIEGAGVVRRSEYYSPIQDAVLTRERGPSSGTI